MLYAKKTSYWRNDFTITTDDQHIAQWHNAMWRNGGSLTIDQQSYDVRGSLLSSAYRLIRQDGTTVASAGRVGRKTWSIDADGSVYEFRRASWWRQDQQLVTGGQAVGIIRRTSPWRGDAVADLPGLSLPLQAFALVVVLTIWANSGNAAATASSAG